MPRPRPQPALQPSPALRQWLPGLCAGAASYLYAWLAAGVYHSGSQEFVWIMICGVGGFLAALLSPRNLRFVFPCVMAGALGLNIARIVVDTQVDPTSHNLFPFELALTGIATAGGAIPGILLAALLRWAWSGKKT